MRKIHSKTVHQNIELIPYDSASCHIYTHISQLLNELHLIIPIVYKTLIKERSVRRPSKHYIRFLIVVHYAAKFRHLSRLPQRPRLGRIGVGVQAGLLQETDATCQTRAVLKHIVRQVLHSPIVSMLHRQYSFTQLLNSRQLVKNTPRSKKKMGTTTSD